LKVIVSETFVKLRYEELINLSVKQVRLFLYMILYLINTHASCPGYRNRLYNVGNTSFFHIPCRGF